MLSDVIFATIAFSVATVILLSFGIYILSRAPQKTPNRMFFVLCVSVAVFMVTQVVTLYVRDPQIAMLVWSFNILNVFIATSHVHWTLSVTRKTRLGNTILIVIYTIALLILFAGILNQTWFLNSVVPKMYFKSYLDGGPLHSAMIVFLLTAPLYAFYRLLVEHRRKSSAREKTRVKYFITASVLSYAVSPFAFLLVLDIPVDPILSALVAMYVVLLAYGMTKQTLADIEVVIKKTLLYVAIVIAATGALIVLTSLSNWFVENIPGFKFWTIPLAAAVVAFLIGIKFWKKTQEADKLKYEFITVAANKLRFPVNKIQWELENLLEVKDKGESEKAVSTIRSSSEQLLKLSNVLLESAKVGEREYFYSYTDIDLKAKVALIIHDLKPEIEKKSVNMEVDVSDDIPLVSADSEKITSAMRALVENAIMYTPSGGTIKVELKKDGDDKVLFSVKDSGIGISKDDLPLVFGKFYRSDRAKAADTEGVGLGLYTAAKVIEKHDSKINVESEGEDKGSVFWFSIPVIRRKSGSGQQESTTHEN